MYDKHASLIITKPHDSCTTSDSQHHGCHRRLRKFLNISDSSLLENALFEAILSRQHHWVGFIQIGTNFSHPVLLLVLSLDIGTYLGL